MKKILLTLIVSLAFCGSVFSQYETHWPDFVYRWQNNTGITAAIAINGHVYTVDDEGWDALEVGFFVGEEQRGVSFLDRENVDYYGDPYPITPGAGIGYNDAGEAVTFKLYDHANGVSYETCEVTYMGESLSIITGVEDFAEYMYAWMVEPYDPIILNFISEEPITTLSLSILGYNNDGTNEYGLNADGKPYHYYLIASPKDGVNPGDITGMTDGNYDLYSFNQSGDEEGKEWITGVTTLERGKGYLYAHDTDIELVFNGPFNTEAEVELAYDANAGNWVGWNLVGNPLGVTAYIEGSYYVMNEDGSDLMETSGAIEPLQGLFVIATEAGSLSFSTDPIGGKKLNLNLSNGRCVIDRASVNFGQDSQLPKFQLNRNSTKVYIPMNDQDYAVVNAEEMGELPVNFKAEFNGNYNLSFNAEEVSFAYLHLIDNMNGNDVDLLQTPSYSFEAKTTDYASRFKLVFATGNASDDNFAFFSNGSFVINNEGNATLQVIDVTGRIISSETINGCANVNVNAANGVYMLRLVNGDNVKTQKVVVK